MGSKLGPKKPLEISRGMVEDTVVSCFNQD